MAAPAQTLRRDETHTYWLGDRRLISVTQALHVAGLIDDRWWSERARLRGDYVHQAIALYEEGDLDLDSLAPEHRPYFDAYLKFRGECRPEWERVEAPVVDEGLGYAGTFDLFGLMGGRPSLVDTKTGSLQDWTGLQLAGYRRRLDVPLVHRYGLVLRADGTYRLVEYRSRTDERFFLAALAVAHWKEGRRG